MSGKGEKKKINNKKKRGSWSTCKNSAGFSVFESRTCSTVYHAQGSDMVKQKRTKQIKIVNYFFFFFIVLI